MVQHVFSPESSGSLLICSNLLKQSCINPKFKAVTKNHRYLEIPRSRIPTFDVYAAGLKRHHVSAMLEFDVTSGRKRLRELKRKGQQVSFTAWMIKAIAKTLELHPEAAAYRCGKKRLMVFDQIRISLMVEKTISGKRVPIPMIIDKANEKTLTEITREIENAKTLKLSEKGVVLDQKPSFYERMYFHLPGFLRRSVWQFFRRNPAMAYRKAGNAVITSLGMMGRINGWFIPRTIHPIAFGIGSVIPKPVVAGKETKPAEVLNMTILFDHDVIDGAPMVRFLKTLNGFIENAGEM